MRKLISTLFLSAITIGLIAQELNATVRINTQKLQSADPKVFETLESTVREFLNTQKWTEDVFENEERINANFLITIQEELSPTSFKADIALQASRPVYGSDYETPLINHIDKGVTFFYEQFQPLQFSQNVYNDNLSSVLAFHSYIILGLDYDSYSPFGGEPYFQAAQDILNNVPQAAAAANPGWRSLDGNRNRFWLIENLLSPRVRPLRQAWYDYHRQGLDVSATDVATGRAIIAAALEQIRDVDQAYPNSMIIQVFTDTKSQEILEIFKRGTPQEQNTVVQVMTRIDASNAAEYRAIK
ncbi:MAG: DUF4835 family protein [Phaeodactylibacter sp.]|nr:DUF4835 family protein [Phaeodactylibacter sp.]